MNERFPPPERNWVEMLREACERTSQRRVARQIGSNPTTICQVLRGTYRHATDDIEAIVRAHLSPESIECPALGRISSARCAQEQREPFSAANPVAVRRFRACRSGCPRFRGREAKGGES